MSVDRKLIIRGADQRRKQGLWATWVLMFRHIIDRHELIGQLFIRDFFMVNKRSFLGSAWLFIAPIFGMISWLFLNMAGLLEPGEVSVPYPLYLLNGTLFWGFFMGVIMATKDTLFITMGYVSQVNFPHEIVLVKQIMQALANILLGFVINIVVMLAFGYVPTLWVFALPVLVLPIIFLAGGMGVILSVLRIVFPDIDRVMMQVLPLLMYTAPIIYSSNVSNAKVALMIKYNPLTYVIGVPRDVILLGGAGQPWYAFIWCTVATFVFFLIAIRIFYVSEEIVIERLY